MRYRVLGKSGLFVSELCLGTMTFGKSEGRYAAASGVDQKLADSIVGKAFDNGINFIDTANVYANGQAETIVGQSLKNLGISRNDIVIATKAEHSTGRGPNDGGASRNHLISEVKSSLKRLGTDYIDLFQLHGWDPATSVDELLRAMDDLVRAGYVRNIGVCNWSAWQVSKALAQSEKFNMARFQSIQSYYSLSGRDIEREIIPMADVEGLSLLAYSPLAGGYLTGKYRNTNPQGRRTTIQFPPVDEHKGDKILNLLSSISSKRKIAMECLALAWLLQQKTVTSVILGVKNIEQLECNLSTIGVTLSEEELAGLNEVSALTVEYPGWMFASADAARLTLFKTGQVQKSE